MLKKIIIKFNYPGFHYWKNKKYKYLSYEHRHIFFWEITVVVKDSNREIEFIDFKDKIIDAIKNAYDYKTGRDLEESKHDYDFNNCLYFGNMSCEMIAEATKMIIDEEFNIQVKSVSVLEDNENGAILEW